MDVDKAKHLFKNEFNEKIISENLMGLRALCANEKSEDVLEILDCVLKSCKSSSNTTLIVDLYELKIKQLYHFQENLPVVERLVEEMTQFAQGVNYLEGLALSFQIKGYLELLKGNRKASEIRINQAMEILWKLHDVDQYTFTICSYSYAVNTWLSQRNYNVTAILENCSNYFFENQFYRSFALCLLTLTIIYQQTQNRKKSIEVSNKFFRTKDYQNKLPDEIKSIVYFCIGFSQELSLNLARAEEYLLKTKRILQPIYQTSIYSSYYVTALSYLVASYALQGKLELAWNQMNEVNDLIEEGIVTRNLDNFSKQQLKHIFNLTKFYIISRLQNPSFEGLQELIEEILLDLDKYYSNAMFFSEFLLNANLSRKQLIKIKKLNTHSTKRVEHVLDFLIEKRKNIKEQQVMELISALKRRPVVERMTLEEKAFADLLAAQEYFRIGRYSEIYPLLRKYKKQLDQIEVLELRLFMEAFIQIGAHKNGDLMGPIYQYFAIKKCRLHKFTKLENKLLDYLDIQAKQARAEMTYRYS